MNYKEAIEKIAEEKRSKKETAKRLTRHALMGAVIGSAAGGAKALTGKVFGKNLKVVKNPALKGAAAGLTASALLALKRRKKKETSEYKTEIEKIAKEKKDNPKAMSVWGRYKEYDEPRDVGRRVGKHTGIGAALGAGAGALITKKLKGAGMGAGAGALAGLASSQYTQAYRDNKALRKRYEGHPDALRRAVWFGNDSADKYLRNKKADYKEGIEKLACLKKTK